MNFYRMGFIFVAAAILIIALNGQSAAFHAGGVGSCDGCHSMHQSADNPIGDIATANDTLLRGSDASSTCLNCHAGSGDEHIFSADGSNTNAGGDFYWVANPYTVDTGTFGGDNAGHNIIAADYGFLADPNPSNSTAPGGSYPASNLGCTSCHDAHGQVLGGTGGAAGGAIEVSGSYDAEPTTGIRGNYRLLGDSAYTTGDHGEGEINFNNNAPVAEASGPDGASVDYGQGMSEWCANCHGDFITTGHVHPAGDGEHLNGYASNYNSYVTTGDFTGVQATSYDDLVPFERGIADHGILDAITTEGPRDTETTNVMCLTCHRAHASAHNNAGRWDFEVELIAESHALLSPDVPATAAPYYKDGLEIDVATVYGPYQRSLCNKCHVQD